MIILMGLLAYVVDAPAWFWIAYWAIIILKMVSIVMD